MQLEQKEILRTRIFKITEQELIVSVSKWGTLREVAIPYENITKTILSKKDWDYESLFLGLLSFIFGLLLLDSENVPSLPSNMEFLAFGVSIFFFVLSMFSRRVYHIIRTQDDSYIHILKRKPSEQEVDTFLEGLFIKRDQHLNREYGGVDINLSYEEQLKNFKKLHKNGVWSREEFEQKCQKLSELNYFKNSGYK